MSAEIRYLTIEHLLHIARRTLEAVEVRDIGLLESAVARPRMTAFGEDAYQTLETKAAALVHSLAKNHALVDGNKRLALTGLIGFLGANGRRLTMTEEEAYDFIIAIAEGTVDDVEAIADRLGAYREQHDY